jgi:hemerythrin-like domain-containing protein
MLRDRALVPLSEQHQHGLALCVLTERSLEGNPSPEIVSRLAGRVVDRYDEELSNHFAIEEEDVFPAIEQELGETPIIHELVAEHRQIEKIVERLRTAPDAALLREFVALLRTHIRREENELLEDVQQRLSRKALESLGAKIDAKAVRIPI